MGDFGGHALDSLKEAGACSGVGLEGRQWVGLEADAKEDAAGLCWAMRACRSIRNQTLAGSVLAVNRGRLRPGCWFKSAVAVRPQLVRGQD